MTTWNWLILMIYVVIVTTGEVTAQDATENGLKYDTNYIESYRNRVTVRLQLSRKTAGMNLVNGLDGYKLKYRPNKSISLGMGLTYKFATIKVSSGIYQPNENKGRTRNFDFQFHRYGRKYVMDFVVQVYKGFYLGDQLLAPAGHEYYVRPDLAVAAVGGSFQHVFNHRRFSYRAAFQQTEIQKKSAGSFFVGLELFLGRFKGDSTLVPLSVRDDASSGINKMRFLEFGPNAGYAYTWVYRNFFVTGGASLSLNVGVNRFFDDSGAKTYIGLSPNTVLRASTGYNHKKWGFNVLLLSTALHLPDFDKNSVVLNTGMVRFNVIYRLIPSKKIKRYLEVIDKADDKLHDR